jgi:biopolymer transport protein ExbD/biopolymer transport protein TolR
MAMVKRNEGSKINSDINVTPMVDVMLVLLIIFMVVLPLIKHPVDMAKTDHPVAMPNADRDDSIIVAVTRDGRVYLGRDRVNPDQLTAEITDRLERTNNKQVFVKADAHARYGAVVDVVNQLRAANIEQLGLLTEQNRHMLPPPSLAGQKHDWKT